VQGENTDILSVWERTLIGQTPTDEFETGFGRPVELLVQLFVSLNCVMFQRDADVAHCVDDLVLYCVFSPWD
jgi:hypothetical protein